MKKRIVLVVSLLLCAAILCGCSSSTESKHYDVVTNAQPAAAATQNVLGAAETAAVISGGAVTAAPTEEPVLEEVVYETPAPTMASEYAGATPVVIDPIDKPTPTPLPALSFNYQTYDATKLHISFEGPTGWTVDDSWDDTYIITNPSTAADYQAYLEIRVTSVSSNYTTTEMKNEVTSLMSSLKGDYYTFSSTKTASRTLLDKDGVYADYTATRSDGVTIKGRIHVACVNKTLYIVHMSTPSGYYETYKDTLYARFRSTIKITQ